MIPVSTLLEILLGVHGAVQGGAAVGDVSTLLEILQRRVHQPQDRRGGAAGFQPFLRFYLATEPGASLVKIDELPFQPFLRFYIESVAGLKGKKEGFQPFLRFYPPCGSALPRGNLSTVSTLLEILLGNTVLARRVA